MDFNFLRVKFECRQVHSNMLIPLLENRTTMAGTVCNLVLVMMVGLYLESCARKQEVEVWIMCFVQSLNLVDKKKKSWKNSLNKKQTFIQIAATMNGALKESTKSTTKSSTITYARHIYYLCTLTGCLRNYTPRSHHTRGGGICPSPLLNYQNPC